MKSLRVRPGASQHSHPFCWKLPSTGMVLLCLAALSVQTGRIWRKMVPHLGQQLEFCLFFGPQAKAGGLMAPAPSAPSMASALSHPGMQHGKLGGSSGISSQNVTGAAPRGSN